MADITNDRVRDVVAEIQDPDIGKGLGALDMIKDVSVCDDMVKIQLRSANPTGKAHKALTAAVEGKVKEAFPELKLVNVKIAYEASRPHGRTGQFATEVQNFIAVGSGKGGVGKSTCAMNIAIGLANTGARVGLLDTDVYGPSVPLLAGISREEYLAHAAEAKQNEEKDKPGVSIPPIEKFGVKIMSIGFLVDPDKAVIWRGPMVHQAVQQFLRDVDWGPLDYLIIDMPPGTGDVQITLSQTIPLTGAVLVCTPQTVALADAKKAYGMFETTKTEVLGMIENMSWFELPDGTREHIFGEGGAAREAEALDIPLLGSVPLETGVRIGGDEGKPLMATEGESPARKAFQGVVDTLASVVAKHNFGTRPRRSLKIIKT